MRGWRSRRGPRWSPIRFARRSALGHRRGQTLALLAVSALITACAAFAPLYDRAMQQALVDTLLAHASHAETTVTVLSESVVDAGGETDARDPRDLEAMVPADIAAHLGPPLLGRTASVTSALGDVPPTGPLVWRDGACEHLRVLSGTCPEAPGEILVSEADAKNFGLAIGATPTVGQAVVGMAGVPLEVVGTYEPRDPAFWQGQTLLGISGVSRGTDPTAAHDAWVTSEATFADSPILPGETAQSGALLRTGTIGVDELLALDDRIRAVSPQIGGQGPGIYLLSDLHVVAKDVRAQTRQAHRTVPMLMAPMVVLALYVLWLVLGAAIEQRRGEVAVARLRGRRPAGAVGLLLIELLPVLLLGVVPGAVAAILGGVLARRLLPGNAPLEAGSGFAVAIALAVAAMVLITVAAGVRIAREPLDGLVRRGRTTSARWAFSAVDAFLVAAVGTGVLAFVTGSLHGPFALAGPAFLALLAGLLVAHLAAPAATASGQRMLRRGRLVTGVVMLETGRRRETRAVIAVITVASALAVFAVDALAVGERNRTGASEQDAGAPVVLRLDGHDLDDARKALRAADPTGHRATPVMISGTTLAVEPDGFRRIALFPRGAPTAAQWKAIAPPASEPVALDGTRMSLTVRTADEATAKDALGTDSEVDLGLVATTSTGVRRTIPLGAIARAGGTTRLEGHDPACAGGCSLAAVQVSAAPGVELEGGLDLSDLRVDGRAVDWGHAADWNTTEGQYAVIRPSDGPGGALRLDVSTQGIYPADVTPAWVPVAVPALLPAARKDPLGPEVNGLDGKDRAARSVGRIPLVPTMPRRSALVDLDALSRGAQAGYESRIEVWLVDDPALLATVRSSLRDQGVNVVDVRRLADVRQTYQDTVATWSLALGAVVGSATVLVALLVLLVLAVTGWRERSRDLAVLRLSGADRRTTRRLAVWSLQPAILLAIAAGVASGLVGAALAMPDVPLFATPPQAPVIDLATAWPAVLSVTALYLVVLPVAAAAAGRRIARRAHVERVREAV